MICCSILRDNSVELFEEEEMDGNKQDNFTAYWPIKIGANIGKAAAMHNAGGISHLQ